MNLPNIKVILIAILGLLNLSMVSNVNGPFLTEYDFYLENDSDSPSPTMHRWDSNDKLIPSYNEWMCFPVQGVTLSCSEHEMEEIVKTPMVAVYDGDEVLEIETSTIEDIECEKTLQTWQGLISGQETFCVLAAYLQDLSHENYGGTSYRSLWILDVFKTRSGYWISPSLRDRLDSQ